MSLIVTMNIFGDLEDLEQAFDCTKTKMAPTCGPQGVIKCGRQASKHWCHCLCIIKLYTTFVTRKSCKYWHNPSSNYCTKIQRNTKIWKHLQFILDLLYLLPIADFLIHTDYGLEHCAFNGYEHCVQIQHAKGLLGWLSLTTLALAANALCNTHPYSWHKNFSQAAKWRVVEPFLQGLSLLRLTHLS